MSSAAARGSRCANIARATRSISRSSAPVQAGARWPRCSPSRASRSSALMPALISARSRILPPTRPSRTSSTGPMRASSTGPTRSRWAARTGQGGGRLDRPLRDGVAALPARMVQIAHHPRLRCRLADLVAGDVALLRGGRDAQINISGPLTYPWGPKRPRYPYRAHELNEPANCSPRDARRSASNGPKPRSPRSPRRMRARGQVPPCAYRGFCRFGCTTNAKQLGPHGWIPRALAAGAEIRDLAMVGRIETGPGRPRHAASTIIARARGTFSAPRMLSWRAMRSRRRVCFCSANQRFPDGLANSSGLVGKNLMTQSNQAFWGRMDEPVRWYKAPRPRHHRALELRRQQGFPRRLLLDGTGAFADRMGLGPDGLAGAVGRQRCARRCSTTTT